jgi:hypothetical protein
MATDHDKGNAAEAPRNVERRAILKGALGAGVVAAAGLASVHSAGAQVSQGALAPVTDVLKRLQPPKGVPNPVDEVCTTLNETVQQICPPQPSCELPPSQKLDRNQVEITVPEGVEVLVAKTEAPVANIVLRVRKGDLLGSKPSLVYIPIVCCE